METGQVWQEERLGLPAWQNAGQLLDQVSQPLMTVARMPALVE